MSAYSAENLPVATPKVEMVEVVAPGTLSEGFVFQAVLNGVVFPVTVVRFLCGIMGVIFSSELHLVHLSSIAFIRSLLEEFKKDRKSLFRLPITKRRVN